MMDREKAIEILQRLADGKSEELYIFDDEGGDICGQILEEQTAIMVGIEALKERPHGEWKTEPHSRIIHCSNCDAIENLNRLYVSNFCYSCGADMRKSGKEK